jgi:hypothetical protein
MRRIFLAAAVLLLAVHAAQAKLEIKDIKAVQGMYGPERKSLDVLPGDEVFFRFTINGVKTDEDGKVHCLLSVQMADSEGKELFKQESPIQGVLALGGASMLSSAFVNFGDNFPAGAYKLTVTVEDQLSKDKDSFTRTLNCRKPEFAIVAPRFYQDKEQRVPATIGGRAGQALYFRVKCIGFKRDNGKIDNQMAVELLDAEGQSVTPKPVLATFTTDDAEMVKQVTSLNFTGDFALNRPGDFTLRITITDRLAKRTAKFEAPLRILAP